jgi:hypothetical protein
VTGEASEKPPMGLRLQGELTELVRLLRSALAQGVGKEELLNLVFDAIHDRNIDDRLAGAVRSLIAEKISRELNSRDDHGPLETDGSEDTQ